MRDCFLEDNSLMLVIGLVSKWEICWALWSLVLFDPVWRPDPNNIAWPFLMGDLLRPVGLNPIVELPFVIRVF